MKEAFAMPSGLRNFLFACAVAVTAGSAPWPPARAEPIELRWEQLIPRPQASRDLIAKFSPVQHMSRRVNMSVSHRSDLVEAYDGERVRIAGFVLPFNNDEPPYKRLLLIPFSGACVEFPPPRNQAILVTYEKGIQLMSFADVFAVTGLMQVAPMQTDIAEIGYRIAAETLEQQP